MLLIMEAKQEESGADNGIRQRKFGLPDWMVNNIERLNFATDFDQFSCTPPEPEGFLSEYKENQDRSIKPESFSSPESKPIQEVKIPNVIETDAQSRPSKLIINPPDLLPSLHPPLKVKSEELFSSPDSTPCATPEPSPVVRRKMSNPNDTVITNPGRWFYLGKMNKHQKIGKESFSDLKNKENKTICDELSSVSVEPRDSILNSNKNGIKLMISNFDLNAVSPTSW